MVVDREDEIKSFVSARNTGCSTPHLSRGEGGGFSARFYGRDGKKQELHSEDEVNAIIDLTKGKHFTVDSVKRGEKQQTPAPPFITSTLQQEASRRLGMTPRRTMSIAQQLYEGVDITGRGTVGLITYMRTDSLRLSEEALAAARGFIINRYGEAYYPGKPRPFQDQGRRAGRARGHTAHRRGAHAGSLCARI